MTLNELNAAIIKWADDREITKHSTPYAQAFKTAEEVQELIGAVAKHGTGSVPGHNDYSDEIRDAIGDVYVTLVVGMACCPTGRAHVTGSWDTHLILLDQDVSVKRLQQSLINLGKYSNQTQTLSRGYTEHTEWMVGLLRQISKQFGTTLEECVNGSYLDIKDRKGRLLPNGIFVKEE